MDWCFTNIRQMPRRFELTNVVMARFRILGSCLLPLHDAHSRHKIYVDSKQRECSGGCGVAVWIHAKARRAAIAHNFMPHFIGSLTIVKQSSAVADEIDCLSASKCIVSFICLCKTLTCLTAVPSNLQSCLKMSSVSVRLTESLSYYVNRSEMWVSEEKYKQACWVDKLWPWIYTCNPWHTLLTVQFNIGILGLSIQ